MGTNPAPSRPVPRAENPLPTGTRTTQVVRRNELDGSREGAKVGHPLRSKRDHGPAASERLADLTPKQGRG